MDAITQHDIRELAERGRGDAVSLYLPIHRHPQTASQNSVRWKNLLAEAETQLIGRGRTPRQVREQLQPAADPTSQLDFLSEGTKGLALFLADGYFRRIESPVAFDELAVVAPAFYIVPLVPLLASRMEFYVLAASQKHVRLLKGDGSSGRVVEVQDLPQNLRDALHYQPPQHGTQAHLLVRKPGGQSLRSMHGQGGESDFVKEEITEFFRMIDAALHPFLREEKLPLVFAGVDHLFPLYREVNSYPHLAEVHVHGAPDQMSDRELHDRACELLRDAFDRPRHDALRRAASRSESDAAACSLSAIVPAANQGRVETLLIARGEQEWGTFHAETQKVSIDLVRNNSSEELLNRAAIETIGHAGSVFLCPKEEMPQQGMIAALYRWPAATGQGAGSSLKAVRD